MDFTDNIALMGKPQADAQNLTNRVEQETENRVHSQLSRGMIMTVGQTREQCWNMDWRERLEGTDSHLYLGSVVLNTVGNREDIQTRIGKAMHFLKF